MKEQAKKTAPVIPFTVSNRIAGPTINETFEAIETAYKSSLITTEERQSFFDIMASPETYDAIARKKILNPLKVKIAIHNRNKSLGYDPDKPFVFDVSGSDFDVRPIFDVIEISGVKALIRTLDSVIFDLIEHKDAESITDSDKSMIYLLKSLRDGFIRGSGKMELSYWMGKISKARKAGNLHSLGEEYLKTKQTAA